MSTYREYFGMSGWPFEKHPTEDGFFISDQTRAIEEELHYLHKIRGVGLLTGEVGCGKTTIARRFVEALSPSTHKVVYVKHTTGHVLDVLKVLAIESGVLPQGNRSVLFRAIQEEWTRLADSKRLHPFIVIDESQAMRTHVLEEVRLLCNFKWDAHEVITLLLVGQPVLARKLELGVLEPLASRIVMRAHIGSLTREEVPQYLRHRLEQVGVTHPVITEPAVEALARISKGVPRRLNVLAHHAFRAAATVKAKIIDAEHVKAASAQIIG